MRFKRIKNLETESQAIDAAETVEAASVLVVPASEPLVEKSRDNIVVETYLAEQAVKGFRSRQAAPGTPDSL